MFDAHEIDRLWAGARSAQHDWAKSSIAHRLDVIRRLRKSIARRPDRLVRAVGGRDALETLTSEVIPLADACRFLERHASSVLAPQKLGRRGRPLWLSGARAQIRREPYGLILILAPGNYPLFLPGVQIVQALAAGNAVLVKSAPGHLKPLVEFKNLLVAAGLPSALCQILDADIKAAQAAIAAGIDKLVLTGSAETGRRLLTELAPRLIPATLELSGNGAVFLLPGCDLAQVAAALAFGLRLNGGATCIAPRRVFVPVECMPELQAHLLPLVAELPAAPLADSVKRRLIHLLNDAVERGARLSGELPSSTDTGQAPIVVLDANLESDLLAADIMAPVVALIAVDDTEQALMFDAECPYALSAAIFGPEDEALSLAARLRAGSVTINDLIVPSADPRLPFGGRGESGYGVTRGVAGLLEFTTIKTVSIRSGRFRPHYDPPHPSDQALFAAYLQAAHGGVSRERLRAFTRLFRRLVRRGN